MPDCWEPKGSHGEIALARYVMIEENRVGHSEPGVTTSVEIPESISQVAPSTEQRFWLQLGIYLVSVVSVAALYLPHAGIPFYGDDFEFRFDDPRPYILGAFGHVDLHRFRPIKASWCALNQYLFGEETFVLEAGQVAMHAALGCAVFWFLRRWGLSLAGGLFGAVWFLTSPINVSAVLGGDTTDQVGSGLAGFLSFALAWQFSEECRQRRPGRTPRLSLALGSLVALTIALLFKENALAFAGIVPLVLGFQIWRCRRSHVPDATRRLLVFILISLVITVAYFIYRNAARNSDPPISLGTGVYQFRIGGNIILNELELLGATVLPFSTADAYVALVHRNWLTLSAMGMGLLAWLSLLGVGLTVAKRWPEAVGFGVLAACATVPVVFLNHVSELYSYNLAPFFAAVVALALGALVEGSRSPFRRTVTVICLAGVLSSDLVAVNRKASQLAVQAHKAVVLLPQVVDYARRLPPGGKLLLYDRHVRGALNYSEYFMSPFACIDEAGGWVKHLAKRPDITVDFVGEGALGPADVILVPDTTAGELQVRALPHDYSSLD